MGDGVCCEDSSLHELISKIKTQSVLMGQYEKFQLTTLIKFGYEIDLV